MNEAEATVKKRLKKLIIVSIVTSVLISLGISFIGSASLFILIGSFKYLSTSMPAWEALYIMGITSGITAGVLFLRFSSFIRNQLRSPEKTDIAPAFKINNPLKILVASNFDATPLKLIA